MNGGHKHYPHPDLAEKGSSLQVRILSSPLIFLKRVNSYSSMKTYSAAEVLGWLNGKRFQREQGEQEYMMLYELDLPKIINEFITDKIQVDLITSLNTEMEEVRKLQDFASGTGDAQGYARLCGQLVLLERLIKKSLTGSTHNTVNK
jgi:hypothetical protein